MPKQWKVLPKKSGSLKNQLLLNRKIKLKADEEKFFHPRISDYQKLLDIPGIDKAQERILKAIEQSETVFIYGDYDVDGVSASAIVYRALKSLGANVLPYIPHRTKEGYGLSKVGLDEIAGKGARLVITVDNGIVALEQAEYAKGLGLDLIITDHHTPFSSEPEALAIVHSTHLCGAGVAWCLIKDLIEKNLAEELLQFVSFGTIADMIPLVGLGRAFVVEGLRSLNQTRFVGVKALILEAGLELGNIGAFEVGFIIAPRINAIGRLEHAMDALRILCTESPLQAGRLARLLCDVNVTRQNLTQLAYEEARLLLKPDQKIHILGSQKWVPGIIGLVAAKVCEERGLPAIAISVGEEISKGSARSINGINITENIRNFSELLIDVGGHAGAAGFSLYTKDLELFKQNLENHFLQLEFERIENSIEIEAAVSKKDLKKDTVFMIEEFAPFGMSNPKPILVCGKMRLTDIRIIGQGKHLKFKADGIDAIGFGMAENFGGLQEGQLADLAFYLEINKFNGQENLQLKIKDIKLT